MWQAHHTNPITKLKKPTEWQTVNEFCSGDYCVRIVFMWCGGANQVHLSLIRCFLQFYWNGKVFDEVVFSNGYWLLRLIFLELEKIIGNFDEFCWTVRQAQTMQGANIISFLKGWHVEKIRMALLQAMSTWAQCTEGYLHRKWNIFDLGLMTYQWNILNFIIISIDFTNFSVFFIYRVSMQIFGVVQPYRHQR